MSIPSRKSRREMGSFRPSIWSRRGQCAIRRTPPARPRHRRETARIVAPRLATMLYFRFVTNTFVLGVGVVKLWEAARIVKRKQDVRGCQYSLRCIGEFDVK